MKSATQDKEYTSPIQKLVRFFEKSRDQWTAKCREAKAMLKRVKSRNRFLQKSRDAWRQQAKQLAQELAAAKAAERGLREEVEKLREGHRLAVPASDSLTDFAVIPSRHPILSG